MADFGRRLSAHKKARDNVLGLGAISAFWWRFWLARAADIHVFELHKLATLGEFVAKPDQ